MNTFNKKSLCVALAATGMLGAAGVAQAVNVSADGLGNVLIYPYYTVRNDSNGNAYNTLMSVVNTTASMKAVKVRFREGKNSAEVLDFNVFLSPFDVWTASITPGPAVAPAQGAGQITTNDKSCTIPSFYNAAGVAQQVSFRTLQLEASDNGVARTSEGYFEVFEMATYSPVSVVGINAAHTTAGVPKDCALVTDTSALLGQGPPSGGLFGGVTILSPAGGGAFSQPATALANFTTTNAYFDTGSTNPTYANADPVSNTIFGSNLYQTTWPVTGIGRTNAVTAVLMANAITNEYVLDAGSRSATSWIATFPTKFSYVNPGVIAPFTSTYVTKVGACENFYGVVFNREEGSPQVVTSDDFSPRPGAATGPVLCWEAQSIGFGTSNVFGSANHNVIATPFVNGWATLGFNSLTTPNEHALAAPAAATTMIDLRGLLAPLAGQSAIYFGLPVIGFAAETFQNDAIVVGGKTYLSTFGVSFPHHATKRITPPIVP
ncbi:MAG: hypothetical protein ABW318_18695 [Vicinamibacterales bacterium]